MRISFSTTDVCLRFTRGTCSISVLRVLRLYIVNFSSGT